MSMLKTGTGATLVRTGASVALALSALVAVASSSQAAPSAITPSMTIGAPAGGNTITLTIPAPTTANPGKFVSGTVGVQFQYNATPSTGVCATNPATNATVAASAGVVTAQTVRFLSSTKVSVVVPTLTGGASTWMICAYNAAEVTTSSPTAYTIPGTATVIGKGVYTTATAPTVTSISPSSGPALGGQAVRITGTGFPVTIATATPLTATIGGVALTSIVSEGDGTHFTAVTPARAAGTALTVTVTTGAGAGTGGVYAFKNGIQVLPDTVVGGSTPQSADLDVLGVGFNALTFSNTAGTTPNHASAHVYLVKGVYDPTGYVTGGSDVAKANGESAECISVAVISDTELICTVNAATSVTVDPTAHTYTGNASTTLADGTYTVTVVGDGASATTPAFQSVLSTGATFTVADF